MALRKINLTSRESKRETQIITRSPERMSGTPVFAGTRVPAKTLFDYLAAGDSLNRFLEHFPDVQREQAVALLKQSKLF